MNVSAQHVDRPIVDVMSIQKEYGIALAPAENPYMAMAQQALALGKVDQLDKLLDLHLRWDAEQSRKAFVVAMVAFKSEPMVIGKNKHVSFETSRGKTEYDHAELSDVVAVIVPNMAKHGLSHRWTVRQDKAITVTCIVTHAMGHSEIVEMTAPADDSGGKNSVQAIASTKSYLERYTLLAATGMATSGTDDDARSAEVESMPAKDREWINKVAGLTDYPAYLEMKKAVMADYGHADNIPRRVRDTFNAVAAATKPKD